MGRRKPYGEPLFEMPAESERGAAASREQEHEQYYRLTASVWPALEAIMRSSSSQVPGAPVDTSQLDVFEAHVSLSSPEIAVISTDTLTGRDFTRTIADKALWSALVLEYRRENQPVEGKTTFSVVVDHTDRGAAFF